jgi:hypothetical protein
MSFIKVSENRIHNLGIKNSEETDYTIKNQLSPGGKVVLYIYQEGTPVHSTLLEVLQKIAKNKSNSKFFSVNIENLDDLFIHNYKIISYPVFFIIKDGKIEKKSEIETGEKIGILKIGNGLNKFLEL